MTDDIVQDSTPEVDAPAVENSEIEAQTGGETPAFDGHPAWKPFEDALGPIAYRSIEPELRKMNSAFESKIAATNRALEPFKQFEGVDPAELKFAREMMQEINTNPRGFYDKLHAYLLSTGQVEEAAAVAEQAADAGVPVDDDDGEDPRIKQLQSELEELRNGQNQLTQLRQAEIQQQQHERAVATETSKLEQEVEALKAAGADEYSIRQVLDRAQLHYFRTGKPAPLADLYAQWTSERGSLLDQPRPVDSAPRLAGSGGGTPQQGARDLSSASRNESVDMLAALISAHK